MITNIKKALNQIRAEDILIKKTEMYLLNALEHNQHNDITLFRKRRNSLIKKISIAACIAILVCGTTIGGYAYYITPVSFLSIDINPGIELGVNGFDRIVSATGYNDDGKTVLNGQSVVNMSVKGAVNSIVQSASTNGFISDDGSTIVSLTFAADNAAHSDKLGIDAMQGANDAIKTAGEYAVVYKNSIALITRDESRKIGLTPGKLELIQKIQAFDPAATVDQYTDASVKDIMKKVIDLKNEDMTQHSGNSGNQINPLSTSTPINAKDNVTNETNKNKIIQQTKDIEEAVKQSDLNVARKTNDNNNNSGKQNENSNKGNQQNTKVTNILPAPTPTNTPAPTPNVIKGNGNSNSNKNKNGNGIK